MEGAGMSEMSDQPMGFRSCGNCRHLQSELAKERHATEMLNMGCNAVIQQRDALQAELVAVTAEKDNFKKLFETSCESLKKELATAREMIHTAVKAWGDYAPVPNSNAGRILRDMKALLAGAEPKRTETP